MKRKTLRFNDGFHVIFGNRRAQAAEMTLAAGDSEGGPDNRHRGADQWLFVVGGTGAAVVNKKRYPLRAGTLLLIEHGDTHEIRNTGRTSLRTLNVYVPPAYAADGDELSRGRS
jgi:mannose-6-phosphate isomerase-like protein (cupin superfamily)